jgi:hypothetical protein
VGVGADLVRETLRILGQRIESEHTLVAASHLPAPGLGHFMVAKGKRHWVGTGMGA